RTVTSWMSASRCPGPPVWRISADGCEPRVSILRRTTASPSRMHVSPVGHRESSSTASKTMVRSVCGIWLDSPGARTISLPVSWSVAIAIGFDVHASVQMMAERINGPAETVEHSVNTQCSLNGLVTQDTKTHVCGYGRIERAKD